MEPESQRDKLKRLYQEMADLTLPKCRACPVPLSCCDAMYCENARDYALTEHGITLEETGFANPKNLPFMGPTGCTVPPYLRPCCTLHTCGVNGKGYETTRPFGPPDKEWNDKYFKLRAEIEVLEEELLDNDYECTCGEKGTCRGCRNGQSDFGYGEEM